MLKELLRKADPGPAKKGPPPTLDEAGGDIVPAGGLAAVGAGGDAAEMGPPSVLNSDHLGHFRLVSVEQPISYGKRQRSARTSVLTHVADLSTISALPGLQKDEKTSTGSTRALERPHLRFLI